MESSRRENLWQMHVGLTSGACLAQATNPVGVPSGSGAERSPVSVYTSADEGRDDHSAPRLCL
jgi:hypothetical protein